MKKVTTTNTETSILVKIVLICFCMKDFILSEQFRPYLSNSPADCTQSNVSSQIWDASDWTGLGQPFYYNGFDSVHDCMDMSEAQIVGGGMVNSNDAMLSKLPCFTKPLSLSCTLSLSLSLTPLLSVCLSICITESLCLCVCPHL